MLDSIDERLFDLLAENARLSWAELAREVGLSAPAVAERVRKLEDQGIITGYSLLADSEKLGYKLLAFVSVSSGSPDTYAKFARWAAESPLVLECHIVAGTADFLLKVRTRDAAELERLLRSEILAIEGVRGTETRIVLSTTKESGPRLGSRRRDG